MLMAEQMMKAWFGRIQNEVLEPLKNYSRVTGVLIPEQLK